MTAPPETSRDAYRRVTRACQLMEDAGGPLATAELAGAVHVGERQLQRDFQVVMGVGPREYGEAIRTQRAKRTLKQRERVSDAVFEAGYGSVRAFYEEVGQRLGMTPSEYQRGTRTKASAPQFPLLWSITPSAVGEIIAVATPKGLAAARIGNDAAALEREITHEFDGFELLRDDDAMSDVMFALRQLALGNAQEHPLPVDVQGTAFQARVWQALRRIEPGETKTYAQLAEELGQPSATRAVARACAMNKVALSIPCHRVIRADGSLAGYAWGLEVKQQLRESESR